RREKSGWAEVKNLDLWKKLDELTASHSVQLEKSKGHSGHPENDRCDELAVQEWKKIRGER
ncbi:MAG: ribonuclease HI, partial [Thermoguttaceae bacterium]|nr:ribonuclease HI [Thermoguttaceae bacterium]